MVVTHAFPSLLYIWPSLLTIYKGKGPNIWDTFSHTPGNVDDNYTGDVACDSYHKLDEDIKIIKDMNVGICLESN